MEGLVRCSANDVPLSPITFLDRAAKVYRDRTSVVYGGVNFTWGQTYHRCVLLASALSSHLGVSRGDVVCDLLNLIDLLFWVVDCLFRLCNFRAYLDFDLFELQFVLYCC